MEEWLARLVRVIGERRVAALVRRPPGLWALRAAMRLLAPRHWVGAVGAVFDERGRVLVVEHVFRTDYPWGLPGGWVDGGEDPADAIRREFSEELRVVVDVERLLCCARVEPVKTSASPAHLGLAYYCSIAGGVTAMNPELMSAAWVDPLDLPYELAPFQRQAAVLGREHFDRLAAARVSSSR